ncbi:MAG: hypothetical protein ACREVO_15845 [Steroidobacteraceae bacterium]
MPTSLSLWLTCAVLLTVMPVAASSADARVGATAAVSTARSDPDGDHAASTGQYASEVPLEEQRNRRPGNATLLTIAGGGKDGSIAVADEADFVVGNRFRTDGGYDATLKSVARVDYYGTRYVDCEHYRLEIHTARPDQVATLLKEEGASVFESHREGKRIAMRGQPQGLPDEVERALLETFDFDTPVIDLESKHPTIQPIGMLSITQISDRFSTPPMTLITRGWTQLCGFDRLPPAV